MKKQACSVLKYFKKFDLKISLSVFLFLVAFINTQANTYSQNTKISLDLKEVPIEKALEEIESLTTYSFLYNDDEIDFSRIVTVRVKNKELSKILHELFAGNNITYAVIDKQIILKPGQENVPEKLKARTDHQVVQQLKVTGKVTDEKGRLLPGVNIVIKGTTTGTQTDFDGKYSIKVKKGDVLQFSFLGMKTIKVTVSESDVYDVVMKEDRAALEEVVLVGYGAQKKSDLTGAVSSVSNKDLTLGGTVSNVAQALQGRTAGVLVTQNSKAPGGSVSVRVRGANSILSTNEPLYVVDGFPTSNGFNISPGDIESIQILKDASAAAIYGSRGANGVILITTKRAKVGENNFSYNGYVGFQKIINPFDMLSGKEYMMLANDLYREIEGQEDKEYAVYTKSQLRSNVSTNWIETTTEPGMVNDHNIQFRSGTQKTKIMTSLGYFKQEGILKNTNLSRIYGRVNIDRRINSFIKAGTTVLLQRENSDYQLYSGNILNQNVFLSILTYDPTVPPYNADGSYGRPPGGRGDNPLANVLERINDLKRDKLNGSLFMEVEPIEGLTARINGGAEVIYQFNGNYLPRSTYQGGIDNGVASTRDYNSIHALLDVSATYQKDLVEKHSIKIMTGYSYEKRLYQYRQVNVKGFSTDLYGYNRLDAASTITSVSSYKGENLLISFFSRLNYAYKSRYLATFTLRYDGSSRFGAKNRWGLFPSGSIAWRLDQEEWIRNLELFSNFKLRLGYGKTGNDRIGDYSSLALFNTTHLTFDGSTTTVGTHLRQTTPENPNLKWETTAQINLGIDLGFFQSRLLFNMDLYHKKTTDLLVRKNFPLYSGFLSGNVNVGVVENKGMEINISTKNLTGTLNWNSKLNFALNNNKIVSLGGESDIRLQSSKPIGNVSEENFAIITEGKPLGSLYGYVYEGILQEGENYAPQPDSKPGDPKFKDISGPEGKPDGKITSDDRTIIGTANPDFIFGLTNTFFYKNIDLSIFIHGIVGNQILNMTRMNLEWARTREALDRWTVSNKEASLPRNGFYYQKYGGYINDHFIENASFLRLKNITMGYTLPLKLNFINKMRVYINLENLFTITQYSGWDPEVDTKANESGGRGGQTANAGAGLDFNSYPGMRSYSIGLNMTF